MSTLSNPVVDPPVPSGFAPAPLSEEARTAVEEALRLLRGRRISVLTGAGVSTDSGIPDYRGQGAPVRNPMSFQHFLGSHQARQRYWAGSHVGWRRFSAARPNAGHRALAELEDAGVVNGIVTQNVDGLHLQAGSRRVVDLHGSLDRVRCLACGQLFDRGSIAERLTRANPWLEDEDLPLNPDGDVTVEYTAGMVVPECSVCGGMLKPEVVFFGEFVPVEKFTAARAIVESSQALVVVGSSLVVNSGLRLVDVATRRRLPVIIINRGQTKGDRRASARIDAGTTEVLQALRQALLG